MYTLSDQQIDFILSDIRARGLEMEDLQHNLLDHVCCIIEKNLETNGDFESFYQKTIRTFYKEALWEIEEETISLLTFKHYYAMKKIMILSGTMSVITLIAGIFFKYMYWPGAALLIPAGILGGSLIFLPLLFTLKARERQTNKDKLVMALGALGVILVSLSFLFRVMHWPYSTEMVYVSAALMLLVFLPLYFFSGIKNPDTKLNTIITSMLVILMYGLLFMMLKTPASEIHEQISESQELGITMEILMNEARLAPRNLDSIPPAIKDLHEKMYKLCDKSKAYLFWRDFPMDTLSDSYELKFDRNKPSYRGVFNWDTSIQKKMDSLLILAKQYNMELNKLGSKKLSRIRLVATILDRESERISRLSNATVTNELIQIQMIIHQNTRTILAMKHKKLSANRPALSLP